MTQTLMCTLLALSLLSAGNTAPPSAEGYHVIDRIQIGGDGGWDYLTLDAAAHRLYVARANRVTVVDVEARKVVGEIPNTPGVHGVALVPKLKRGFVSNGGDSTVTVFDVATLRETARVKVGNRPDAILYDPASDRVFTFNAGSSDATAVNPNDGTVAGTVKLGGKPEAAVADEKGLVFVNIEDKNEVVAFDAKELTVKHRWPLAPGATPTGLALDRATHRLFATCRNEKLVVLDADSGRVLATPAIGKNTDGAAFDPAAGLAFSSNGDGTLTVVDTRPGGDYPVVANVATQAGARTMALDPTGHRIYLATARFKQPAAGGRSRREVEPDSFVILVVGK